jgi:hypothetical protein
MRSIQKETRKKRVGGRDRKKEKAQIETSKHTDRVSTAVCACLMNLIEGHQLQIV